MADYLGNAPQLSNNTVRLNGREPGLSSTIKPQFKGAIAKRALAIQYVRSKNVDGLIEQLSQHERRAFAADCAAHCLHFFETIYSSDERPRQAIWIANAFLNGRVDLLALETAYAAAKSASRMARAEHQSAAHAAALAATWATASYLRKDDQIYDLWSACLAPRYSAWAYAAAANEVASVLTSELPDILDKLWRSEDTAVAVQAWSQSRTWQLRKLAEYHRI